jgi:hypothetical protein
MLTNTSRLNGLAVQATDGEVGTVDQFYFDDETWAIRYLIVDTGGWLKGRHVLISPMSVTNTKWQAKELCLGLTKKQVLNSPDINTHLPVSRQREAEYLEYYGYPNYWNGPYLWGPAIYPAGMALSETDPGEAMFDGTPAEPLNSHLRSSHAVTGYDLAAANGSIGRVEGFLMDDKAWVIRYLEVSTRKWRPGKKVLVSPAWVMRVSWTHSKVYLGLSRQAITNCPKYDDSVQITREYENRLFHHYGQPPYWLHKAGRRVFLPLERRVS